MRRIIAGIAVAAVAVPLGAAAATAGGQTQSAAACTPATLPVKTAGKLTIGTDNPAFTPWFGGGEKNPPWKINDPSTGKGYESAVAYQVARRLGFRPSQVTWTVVPFNRSFAPGDKPFDLFLNQVSITPQRARNVAFSSSYYNVNQAVVALKGKPITKAKSIAALRPFKLGAPIGTTSLDVITGRVRPDQDPAVYDTLNDGVTALKNGQIDGLVVDLPTSYYIRDAQVENAVIVGQFAPVGKPEGFGIVMQKGSGLASCVTRAVNTLRANGTLARLEKQWLAGPGAPLLK